MYSTTLLFSTDYLKNKVLLDENHRIFYLILEKCAHFMGIMGVQHILWAISLMLDEKPFSSYVMYIKVYALGKRFFCFATLQYFLGYVL